MQRQVTVARRGGDGDAELATVARLTHRSATIQREGLDRLDALVPAPSDTDGVQAWLAELRRRSVVLDALGDAFADGPQRAIAERAEQAEALRERAAAQATRYRLVSCARLP